MQLSAGMHYAIEFDAIFWSSRYCTARRTVQMTNEVKIV